MNTAASDLASVHALLLARRFREAEAACASLLLRDPSDLQARLFQAWANVGLGKVGEASEQLRELVRREPSMVGALSLQAEVELARQDPEAALAAASRALEIRFGFPRDDADECMVRLLEMIAREPPERWSNDAKFFVLFGRARAASGNALAAGVFERARACLPVGSPHADSFLDAALRLLGFERRSSEAWLRAVFENVALPWLLVLLERDRCHAALALERLIYEAYVKRIESQEHFGECFARWKTPMAQAGRRFAARLPRVARKAPGPRPRVAFFLHNVSRLAHVQLLLEVLEGQCALPEPVLDASVFFLQGAPDVLAAFQRAGARTEALGIEHGFDAALARLHRRAQEEGIDVLAWISLALALPFAFAMRIAPRQVWWAMKYRTLATPDIDDYVSGGSQEGGVQIVDGRPWRVGPVASSQWVDPSLAPQAREVRARLGNPPVVYGTFGREEKLTDPAYLDAVGAILREVPEAHFLWTGREALPAIHERFRQSGVAERCHFIGWVNTKLFAHVIDVFLDSFPFPCGYTLYESMAAGKPVLLFASPQSEYAGIHALIAPLISADESGRTEKAARARAIFGSDLSLYLRAGTPEEYVRMGVRLARDPELRARAGNAGRRFVEELMTDRAAAARIYLEHVVGKSVYPSG